MSGDVRELLERYDALRRLARVLAGCRPDDALRHVQRCLTDWCDVASVDHCDDRTAATAAGETPSIRVRTLRLRPRGGNDWESEIDWFSIGYLASTLLTPRDRSAPIERVAGETRAMQQLRRDLAVFSASEFPVMVVAERGSGKGLVARVSHACRGANPESFFAVACAAVPSTLAESELFGHEKGAFTSACGRRQGLFATAFASNGTLFLDDVADFTSEVQPKILQAIEDGVFFPVGSDRPTVLRGDGATRLHVWSAVQPSAIGRLRPDLLDRLSTLVVTIPPLRDRPLDVLLLADRELDRLNRRHADRLDLTRSARAELLTFEWPGNVRQLCNVIDRAFVLAGGRPRIDDDLIAACIDVEKTLGRFAAPTAPRAQPAPRDGDPSALPLKDVEMQHIVHALKNTNGNVSHAARLLGLKRTTLQSRLRVLACRTC